jgi:glycosyltransferase involved in cell wall biosynthesis
MQTLLFIGHEASATGAPFTQLYLIKWLKANTNYRIALVLVLGGALEEEFRQVVDELHVVVAPPAVSIAQRASAKLDRGTNYRRRLLERRVQQLQPTLIFANTALTIDLAARFKQLTGAKLLINIHELDSTFYYYTPERFERHVPAVDMFIMGSHMVRKYYENWCGIGEDRAVVVYDFIAEQLSGSSTAAAIRAQFDIPAGSPVVGGIAVLYPRKGADVFVQVARQVIEQQPNAYCVWVGGSVESPEYKAIQRDLRLLGLEKQVLFVGGQRDLRGYYELFDVFLLPSREDPFPLVCLEAALAGKPVICFDKAGGMPEFVRDDAGAVVPYLDDARMAAETLRLLRDDALKTKMGEVGQQRVRQEHTIATIGPAMYAVMQRFLPAAY